MLSGLKSLDLFPKTLEDFKVRTLSGAAVSIISIVLAIFLVTAELSSYYSIVVDNELVVDTTREAKLKIGLDITFPSLPCNFMSLDVVDIAGEVQLDVSSSIFKQRLDRRGLEISGVEATKLESEIEKTIQKIDVPMNKYGCESCFGAETEARKCCPTCDSVREAYREKGWAFNSATTVAQCMNEGFSQKMNAQKYEGCRVYGNIEVEKVAGNFHISPGRSYEAAHTHIHDTAAVDTMGGRFNMSHVINKLQFGDSYPGVINPLEGHSVYSEDKTALIQYFVKIVPTTYRSLAGLIIESNQYSVTDHYQAIDNSAASHDSHGNPGVFFIYDLSPIQVNYVERAMSFASFLTGICAILGGLFTISSLVDAFLYHGINSIREKARLGKAT